jgi:signal transduction histidine kinase
LLDNAVRYNQPGGVVRMTLSATGVLVIRNTGPEMTIRFPQRAK